MAQNNIFSNAMKPFETWKSFSEQFSSVDLSDFVSNSRKSFEAFSSANQAFVEGAQAVAQRQLEIAQNNAENALQLLKEVASSKDPREGAAKQIDFAKKAIEKSLSDSREIFEIASKSNSKAYELIGKQVSECIKECSKAASPSSASSSKKAA